MTQEKKSSPINPIEITTDQERRKVFLRHVNRAWLILGIVTLASLPFLPEQRSVFIFLIAVTFPTYLIIRFLNLSGRTWLAGVVFTLSVNFGFYGLFMLFVGKLGAYKAFETETTVWMLMGLAVLFAGAFVDKWAAPVLAVLNTILFIGTRFMLAPGSDPRPSAFVFWWMMALTIWLYEDTLQEALKRSSVELAERKQAEETLRESEDKFKYIFDYSMVGKSITHPSGKIHVNKALYDMLGYSSQEMQGGKWQDITHPDDIELTQNHIDLLVSGKKESARFAKRFIHKNGSIVWVDLSSTIRRDEQNKPMYLMTTIIDITERVQAEKALQIAEANYRAIFENAPVGIFQSTSEGRFLKVNQALARIYGYDSPEEIIETIDDIAGQIFVYPSGRGEFTHLLAEYGQVIDFESLERRKDGSLIWTSNNAQAIKDADGQILHYEGFIRDITERRQAEGELQKLASVVQYSSELVNLATLDGRMIFLNEAGSRMLGINPTELGQHTIMEVIPGQWQEMVQSELLPALMEKGHWEGDLQYRNIQTNAVTDVHALTFMIKDVKTGASLYLANVSLDITARKQAEEALRESEARAQAMLSAIPDLVFRMDRQGIFLDYKADISDLYAQSESTIIGKRNRDITPPEFADLIDLKIRATLETGTLQTFEYKLPIPGKGVRDYEARMVPSGVDEVTTIVRDITERKQAEDRLRQSEEQYRVLFNHLPIPAFTKDVNGIYTSCNKENMKYWAVNPIGHTDAEVSPNEIALALHANDQRAIESGETVITDELLKNTPLGDRLFVSHKVPIRDGSGNIIGVLGASLDITERKRIEDETLEKSKELEALFTISSHLRTAQTAKDMIPVVLAQMSDVLKADANTVILLDPDQTHFTFAICDGLLTSSAGLQFDVGNSISGHVMQTRQPYVTLDYANDPLRSGMILDGAGVGSIVVVPLQSEKEFIGTLLCGRAKDSHMGPFTPTEVQLLVSIGEMVGNALRRARLYDDALSRLQRVQGLHSIDSFINANMDIKVTLKLIVTQAIALMNVDAAAILYYDQNLHLLEYASAQGFHYKAIEKTRFELSGAFSEKAILERRVITASDLSEMQDPVHKEMMQKEGCIACYVTPMIAKGKVIGVLELYKRAPLHPDREWLDFFEALGAQAAIAVDNARLFRDLQTSNFELGMAYDATIQGWSHALELKDSETEGHALRVAEMTIGIARLADLSEKEITHIRRGALLHDIGKMGIPDPILNKTGKLTSKEWDIIRQHPQYAYDMLYPIEFLRPALDIPHYHHEKWDGTGYPQGLHDLQIPYAARLFAVIDVWDALTNNRIYRKAWSKKKVFAHIKEQSGKHFDPQVVELFLKYMDTLAARKK